MGISSLSWSKIRLYPILRWRDDPSQGCLVPEYVPVDNTSLWAQHPCIIGSYVQNVPWMLCPKIICPYFMISASQIFFLQWSQRPSFFRDCMTAENILSVGNRDVWWKKQRLTLKGTVQRDFLPPIFSQMDFSQAPYSVFKDFSNLASNSRRYSRFLIDSPLLFIAESQYSPYCLVRRVATLRFIIAGSHYLLELSA
jgi:hypothetical protein